MKNLGKSFGAGFNRARKNSGGSVSDLRYGARKASVSKKPKPSFRKNPPPLQGPGPNAAYPSPGRGVSGESTN